MRPVVGTSRFGVRERRCGPGDSEEVPDDAKDKEGSVLPG